MVRIDDESCSREYGRTAMVAEEYGITVVNLRMKISRARQWLYKNYHQSYLEL